MKKLFWIVIFIIGCNKVDKTDLDNSYLEFWEVKYFVNQQNEPTDVGYVTNIHPILGTFSKLKEKDKPLRVKIMIKERAVGIKLYENNQEKAVKGNNQNPIEYELKIRHNDNEIDFSFKGINENEVVVIGEAEFIREDSDQPTLHM